MINKDKVKEAIKRYGLDTVAGRQRYKNIFWGSKRYRMRPDNYGSRGESKETRK